MSLLGTLRRRVFVVSILAILWSPSMAKEADAGIPVAAAAAIASIETLELAVLAAATIGLISATQSESYQKSIQSWKDWIWQATADSWEFMKDEVSDFIDQLERIVSGEEVTAPQCPTNVVSGTRTIDTTAKDGVDNCSGQGDIEKCCDAYFKFLESQGYTIISKNGAKKIFKGKKLLCCYEPDKLHGWRQFPQERGFEIFDKKRGKHLGSHKCTDWTNDPCGFSGEGFGPMNDSSHKPTPGKCG